jgi:oxygen-dependent protoporphyrinogen oxidase
VLLEPLARGRPRHDETVHAFAARRIGREAADVLVQAMVSGVFAGDARRLSLRATFPKMFEMERSHGSLFRALIARRKAGGDGGPAGPGGTLTSFDGGMETLIEALVARLGRGHRVHLGSPVGGISPSGDGYVLDDPAQTEADCVVLACPAWEAAGVLQSLVPEATALLRGIPGAPIAVVATAYDERDVGGAPPGFGFLVPRGEGVRILGCLWSSSIYPGTRAPEGKVLLRTMVGGAIDPAAVDLGDDALLDLVARDLRTTMDLRAAPVRHWIFRHPRGIPQYEVGHGARLAGVGRLLGRHPRVVLAGNSYRGISVNATIQEAAGLWGPGRTS